MKSNLQRLLWGLGLVFMLGALYMVFNYAPTEKEMGIIQRLFYLMVPAAWLALLSFFIVFVSSIMYLSRRTVKWDVLGYSAAEAGIIFTTLAMVVGSLWARPVWNVWWAPEEPRLASTTVLWFIYLAYLLVRSFASEKSRGMTFAAVVGVIGFIDIPFVILSTTLLRGQHPPLMIFKGGVDPRMMQTLMVSIIAYTILFVLILITRVSLKNTELEVRNIKESSSETDQ